MIPATIRGPAWMLASGACITLVVVLVRKIANEIPPLEAVFFRNAFCLLFIIPALARAGFRSLRTERLGAHALRALAGFLSMVCWFTAATLMPIADVTAVTFLTPIFAMFGAAFLLGEKVRARRWIAAAAGFAGALIVLRPGVATFGPPALWALGAAFFLADAMVCVKSLSRTEAATTILVWQMLFTVPVSAVPAAFVWVTPSLETWPWLAGIGLAAMCGQLLLVRAFAAADASALMPFDYGRLIFASLYGYLLFGEIPDAWTWVGATVIFVAGLLAGRDEKSGGKPA